MLRLGPVAAAAAAGAGAGVPLRSPGVPLMLAPKVRAAARRLLAAGSMARGVALGAIALLFWAVLFAILYRLLNYFRGAEEIGDVLAAKLLGVILLAFLSMLLLSNVITALSSFFLARDLELYMAAPVDPVRVYGARLLETTLHSSWMVALVMVPVLTAYGWVYDAGPLYLGVALAAVPAFLLLPAVSGTAFTLLLVNIFPARRARDLLALIALFGAAGLIALIRFLRPEQLARPEGFRDLVDFVAALHAPRSVWLPSEWAAQAIMAPLRSGGTDLFPLLLLGSTAAAFFVLGAWLHVRLYPEGFSRAQEGAELSEGGSQRGRLERLLRALPLNIRSLAAKDVRTFFRDTTQWSQLILLAVLVVIYVYNIKVLPLRTGPRVGFFLVNLVSFLNIGIAGFVLTAIAARFVFPAVSLEGRTFWLLRSSPLDLRALIWTKYWLGVIPLLVLGVALTLGTNWILRVDAVMMALSLASTALMTFAIASLALGFGAVFPRFDTENAAQIPTGFGGLLFMMVATAYLAGVIVLEAWPVYGFLYARARGFPLDGARLTALALGLAPPLLLSAAAIVLPLRVAVRRVALLEL